MAKYEVVVEVTYFRTISVEAGTAKEAGIRAHESVFTEEFTKPGTLLCDVYPNVIKNENQTKNLSTP